MRPFGVLKAEARRAADPLEVPVPSDIVFLIAGWAAGRGEVCEAIYRDRGKVYASVVRPDGIGPAQETTWRLDGWSERGDIRMTEVLWTSADQPRTLEEHHQAVDAFEAKARAFQEAESVLQAEADALYRRGCIHLVFEGDDE